MFFEVLFSFIFYARAIKPVLTIESFGFVFSKLKLNHKYLIGLFRSLCRAGFPCACLFLKNNLFRVDTVVASRKYHT